MDENTSMMIQLASMMMQNQTAIRETQSQLKTVTDTKAHASVRDADDTQTNSSSAAVPTVSSAASFGMDPKLMAEFAHQVVMNSNKTGSESTAFGLTKGHPKPTTIAQIMQSFESQTSTATSGEGTIFVYNKISDADENTSPAVAANCKLEPTSIDTTFSPTSNGGFALPKESKRSSSVGPIRNRSLCKLWNYSARRIKRKEVQRKKTRSLFLCIVYLTRTLNYRNFHRWTPLSAS